MSKSSGFTTTSSHSCGFTLIELLVAVAIMAVLTTIGINAFNNAQFSAKDGKRITDINNIAKSIETTKDYSTGNYSYSPSIFANDFPKGITVDGYPYCIRTSSDLSTPAAPTTWPSSGCPTIPSYSVIVPVGLSSTGAITFSSIKSWTLCAYKQGSSSVYCVTSVSPSPLPSASPS